MAYRGAARSFLLAAKFGGRTEVLRALGGQLAQVVSASGFARGCDAVVPVPSHPWTRMRRGHNAALEIAIPVGRALEMPLRDRLLVRRLGHARAAKRLGARRRRAAVATAFRAFSRARGLNVLLVDDVMTTGATAAECARVLKKAGAKRVFVATVARALSEREKVPAMAAWVTAAAATASQATQVRSEEVGG